MQANNMTSDEGKNRASEAASTKENNFALSESTEVVTTSGPLSEGLHFFVL